MISYFNEKSLHQTDPKGRLLIPKEIRANFKIKKGDTLYLVPNFANPPYLEIRTPELWAKYKIRLREDASEEKKKNSFRYAMAAKETVVLDGQGRILIPQRIRDHCKLDGKVAVIDMDSYIEVWSKGHFEHKWQDMIQAFKETNDKVF